MSHPRLVAAVAAFVMPMIVAAAILVPAGSATANVGTTVQVNPYDGDASGVPLRLYVAVQSPGGYPTGTLSVSDQHGAVLASDVPLGEFAVANVEFPAGPDEVTRYTVTFHGSNGFADSSTEFTHHLTVGPTLAPDPVVKLSRTGQLLKLLTGATLTNADGTWLYNRRLWFSLGAPYGPDGRLLKGGLAFCSAYTDRAGHADCPGEFLGQSLLAVLTGGYVSYVVVGHPELYRTAKLPVIGIG
jgi:hypothetical protein